MILYSIHFLLAVESNTKGCIPDYYQDDHTYYPFLDPSIIIYGNKSDEAVQTELSQSLDQLQANQKIVACTYFRDKSSVKKKMKAMQVNRWFTWNENKMFVGRYQYSIFISFIVIVPNLEKNQQEDFEVITEDLKNGLGTVAIFKIDKETLARDYMDYFKHFLAPDVENSLGDDTKFLKMHKLTKSSDEEKEEYIKSHIAKMLEVYRQNFLYWDRVRAILHMQELTTDNTLVLDMLTSSKEPVTYLIKLKPKGSVSAVCKQVKEQPIIEVKGFQEKYNQANRDQIFEQIKHKLKDYVFNSEPNLNRYQKLLDKVNAPKEEIPRTLPKKVAVFHEKKPTLQEKVPTLPTKLPEDQQNDHNIKIDQGNQESNKKIVISELEQVEPIMTVKPIETNLQIHKRVFTQLESPNLIIIDSKKITSHEPDSALTRTVLPIPEKEIKQDKSMVASMTSTVLCVLLGMVAFLKGAAIVGSKISRKTRKMITNT